MEDAPSGYNHSSLDDEAGNSTDGVKRMIRKRVWGLAFVFLVMAAIMLVISGCTGSDGGNGSTDETADLPPQDGLEVGVAAPDFRMQSQDQVTVALKDYLGTKNVVLVFYPADFTPV